MAEDHLDEHFTVFSGSHVFVFKLRSSLEFFLRFPSQVSDQPLGGEGVLWGHPITHHCVQEGLPLPRVEAQNLGKVRGVNIRVYIQRTNSHKIHDS